MKNKTKTHLYPPLGFMMLLLSFFSMVSCSKNEAVKLHQVKKDVNISNTKPINWVGHWLTEGNKVDLVRDVAREFEFMNQEYTVNLKFPEEIYYKKPSDEIDFVVKQLQMETPEWDIIRLYGNYEEIATRLNNPNWPEEYLVDFSTVPGFMDSHKPFINTQLYKMRNNQKYFGPHSEGQIAALYVNTEVAKKMGISVKQFGMTFEDFTGYLKAAYEYNQKNEEIIPIFEYNWGKSITIFNILFYSLLENTEEILTKKLTQNKLNAIEQTLIAMEGLAKYKPINSDWVSHDWNTDINILFNDECLFYPNLTFMYGIWAKNHSSELNKIVPCEYPVFKPSKVYVGGYISNWAVLKKSPHRDDAIKLMMHWSRPDIGERWVRMTKSPTGIKGNLAGISFGADLHENYTNTIDKKYELLLRDEDRAFIMGEENTHLNIMVQDVLLGLTKGKQEFERFKSKAVLKN